MGSGGVGDERWRTGALQVRRECVLLTRGHATLGAVHHTHRDLGFNQLGGSIPDSIGNLTQLQTLCVGVA